MKGPSLQKTAALSTVVHLTVLFLSFLIIRESNHIVMPSPYIVSLVEPSKKLLRDNTKSVRSFKKVKSYKSYKYKKVTKPVLSRDDYMAKIRKKHKIDKQRVEDRISELEAKKRVERIVRLRSIISVKGTGEQNSHQTSAESKNTSSSKETLFDSYYLKIRGEIWQEWIYPDLGEKSLVTILLVKIMKDGTITVQGIEKSSGNILFDRSTLKAIAKATPVSPPPYEIEIGIRFYP